jgi:hypothetical protein
MKLGIVLLVVGLTLLFVSIPYSIVGMIVGLAQLEGGRVSGGISSYFGIIAVVAGLVMTGVGAMKVFKR